MQSLLIAAVCTHGHWHGRKRKVAPPAKDQHRLHRGCDQRKKVVSSLNTADLEPGKKPLLYFQGVQMSTGQHWYVSVIVPRGPPGKRITLTSGVHGDEMSSVHTVQTVMNQLNPAEMSAPSWRCWTLHDLPWRACSVAGRAPIAVSS